MCCDGKPGQEAEERVVNGESWEPQDREAVTEEKPVCDKFLVSQRTESDKTFQDFN